MVAALGDDEHVGEQRERYGARRAVLRSAFADAGLRVERLRGRALPVGDPGRGLLGDGRVAGADRGILVAPGEFYGAAGASTSGSR